MGLRLVWATALMVAFAGCDPPPDDYAYPADGETTDPLPPPSSDSFPPIDGDTAGTDSALPGDSESTPGIDTETETRATTCLEAVLCIAGGTSDPFTCTAGMDAAGAAATIAAATCIIQSCADTLDNTVGLLACVASSCSEEARDCVTSSLGGLGL